MMHDSEYQQRKALQSELDECYDTIEAKDKQIQLYKEGIEKISGWLPMNPMKAKQCFDDLLSSPVDKSTDIMSKEINDDK